MVEHQQLPDTLMADAVLAGQDQRVGEELLADGADQLPLYVFDGDLRTEMKCLAVIFKEDKNSTTDLSEKNSLQFLKQ